MGYNVNSPLVPHTLLTPFIDPPCCFVYAPAYNLYTCTFILTYTYILIGASREGVVRLWPQVPGPAWPRAAGERRVLTHPTAVLGCGVAAATAVPAGVRVQ